MEYYLHRLLFVAAAVSAAVAATEPVISKPGCQDHCGDVTIPYPFGLSDGCYLNERFHVNCNASNAALLGNTQVLNVSLQGELRISASAASDCYDRFGKSTPSAPVKFANSLFPLSYMENKFIAVGCDTYALVGGSRGHNYTTGCISYCDQIRDVVNGSCGGIGCCQTSIPKGVQDFEINIKSYFQHQYVWKYNPCSYGFVIEESAYRFSSLDLANLENVPVFPVVLDWAIGNQTCDVARKEQETYACKENTVCYEPDNGPGYRCNCSEGYQGNPYLANGCQDLDECRSPDLNACTHICTNTAGNYTCSCPKRHRGDGRRDGAGCAPKESSNVLSILGISIGITLLFVTIALIVIGRQKRKAINLGKEFFKENGGLMLQQLLFKSKNSVDTAKIFAEDELKRATENFSNGMVIGRGGYGVVYMGVLTDDSAVAIKKSKAIGRTQIEQFVNEVIVLSQIYHPNAVKLLGCCLETAVPLLVYEFISNGTLFRHLHDESCKHLLPWKTRLRIAEETASALAYMHSMQIIHRDVKSANILLDNECTAKVSDFGV